MKKSIIFLLGVFLSTAVIAQPFRNESYDICMETGDEQFMKGQYYNALDWYQKAQKARKGDMDAKLKLAKTNFMVRDYKRAELYYRSLLRRDRGNRFIDDRINYAKALLANGKKEDAIKQFSYYLNNGSDKDNIATAERYLKGIEKTNAMPEDLSVDLQHAGRLLNFPLEEGPGAFDHDGNFYYSSLQQKEPLTIDEKAADYTIKMIVAKNKDGKWTKPEALGDQINREDFHSLNPTFSRDGSVMYFSRVESDGGSPTSSKIYASVMTGGDWGGPVEVLGINGDYHATYPASGDLFGSEVLVFSADIPGGYGGLDLYYATRISETEFSEPINLGDDINTEADEITPFLKNGVLYFSTDGRTGFGMMDIYSSEWTGAAWAEPVNLGAPLNSSVDDFGYRLDPSGKKGAILSNRIHPKSRSYKSKTCCSEIYFFDLRPMVISFEAQVGDENKKGLRGATVQLIEIGNEDNAISKTDKNSYKQKFGLEPDKKYKVLATKEGYFPHEIEVSTVGVESDQHIMKEFILKRIPEESDIEIISMNEAIRLNNIYYDFDDDKILPDAEQDLNFLLGLMNEYPDMVIELSSHTDSRGNDAYNENLSERRARSARSWLIGRGVAGKRIKAIGYGEEQIINECTNGVECSESDHRLNRRTEFKILQGPTSIEVKKEVLKKKRRTRK